ncbi:prepilin peptidase [Ensifer sp. ENS06]|uniref:prepilin peptidase n=1 Tax=Ensifer sp. ENS06 TaxID=2769276 RepID=UPI0017870779|nr:A24 family peptidase [Ensifer sp. ENS06]MBD9624009.1 prepilin peptidase [Ensifer sp. ENS06]
MLLVVCTAVIVVTDFKSMIIPDWINALVLAGGVSYSVRDSWSATASALMFSVIVFAFFWGVRKLHTARTGRVGLGMGDVKFAGAAAAWLSPLDYPLFLLGASFSALLYFAIAYRGHPDPHSVRVPFGPFLSISLLAVWHLEKFDIHLFGFQA